MTTYNANDLRNGMKLLIDGAPHTVVECEFVKPGKGQAFTRVKVRNLKTGRVVERTHKANETFEGADVSDTDMQYLYSDGELWHFMQPESFEQFSIDKKVVSDAAQWLKAQDMCIVTLWDGVPIQVMPPNFVVLEVTDTDPGVRGDTSGSGGKPATTETGAVVRVPLFVQIGELIKVDTRTGEYVSRAKE